MHDKTAVQHAARCARMFSHALVAQGIEHRSPKAGVGGSNPSEGTRKDQLRGLFAPDLFSFGPDLPEKSQNMAINITG